MALVRLPLCATPIPPALVSAKKGSNYLIKEFPNEKKYKESKEKIKDI